MRDTSGSETMSTDNWSAHAGFPLIHTLASAVIQLADTTDLGTFRLPYPAEAQRALDRTALSCLLRGAQPPQSMANLLNWCRNRPLADWPIDLPPDAAGLEDFFIDDATGEPTDLCHELWAAGDRRDSAAAHYDREIIHTAQRLCREQEAPESYTAFRELLVTRPVLTSEDWFEISTDLHFEPVRALLNRCYQPIPLGYDQDGEFVTCERCRTLLSPTADGGWRCERDRCRRRGDAPIGKRYQREETDGLVTLVRPLRQFVTAPGQAETVLREMLRALRLKVEVWPNYDSYDLRVTFPDGLTWAIDVKDWAHPGLLGKSARPVPSVPPSDDSFWVIPQYRADERADYIEVFTRNKPADAKGLRLLTDVQTQKYARTLLGADSHRKRAENA